MEFEALSKQYFGSTAQNYDAVRTGEEKWQLEQRAVEAFLAELPAGAEVLDVPLGTGRFIEAYQRLGLKVTGLDISQDMIAEATKKAEACGLQFEARLGDIRRIDKANGAVTVVVCLRFLNWVDYKGFQEVVSELSRVSGKNVILGVRNWIATESLNVLSVSGLVQLARQALARIRKRLRPAGLEYHRKSDILAHFRSIGLTVKQEVFIERRKKDGTDYSVYLLEKR